MFSLDITAFTAHDISLPVQRNVMGWLFFQPVNDIFESCCHIFVGPTFQWCCKDAVSINVVKD